MIGSTTVQVNKDTMTVTRTSRLYKKTPEKQVKLTAEEQKEVARLANESHIPQMKRRYDEEDLMDGARQFLRWQVKKPEGKSETFERSVHGRTAPPSYIFWRITSGGSPTKKCLRLPAETHRDDERGGSETGIVSFLSVPGHPGRMAHFLHYGMPYSPVVQHRPRKEITA